MLLTLGLAASAQTDWKKVQKLIDNGSYKSAYAQAEKVYKKTKNSSELLTSAWYMMRAATWYQEDSYDSSVARYRAILPRLEAPERAICYALLGVGDSALMDEDLLKRTPSDRVKQFCVGSDVKGKGVDVTPTVYDVVVQSLLLNEAENGAELIEKLVEFHKNDGDDIRIWLDLEYLEWPYKSQTIDPQELYKFYINKYRASKCMRKTQFYSGLAQYLYSHDRREEALRYCDTAIALAPKSTGGSAANALRDQITQTEIVFSSYLNNTEALPGRPSLHILEYRNIGRIHFGIAPYEEDEHGNRPNPKVFRSWVLEVDTTDKYYMRNIFFDVPALETGRWMLVASPDGVFDKNDAMLEIKCTDLKVMQIGGNVFQLVNAITGDPIVGQEVVFFRMYNQEEKILQTSFSDNDGRVRYEGDNARYSFRIVRNGYEFVDDTWNYGNGRESKMEHQSMLFCDRPVYRPGDTVHVAMLHYETNGFNGRSLEGRKVKFTLHDPNYEVRDSVYSVTDDFGVVSAMFIIPRNCLAGGWGVRIESGDDYYDFGENDYLDIWVEEYKQPKFMVSLDATQPLGNAAAQPPTLGQPYTVHGLAQAYSGAKVDGAKVRYTITRYTRYWREYGGFAYQTTTDSTVTAADGSFAITFTPMPDSTANLSRKPNFYYEILAEVTDLNGETQSDQTKIVVGYHNTTLELAGIPKPEVSALESVAFALKDINGRPLEGDVKITVSRLHLHDTARLLLPIMMSRNNNVYNTLSRERFHELFPTYLYSIDEYRPRNLKSDWDWSTTEHTTADELQHTVKLPSLQSGYYRVVATCGEEADTQYVRLTLPDERRVQSCASLIWADIQYSDNSSVPTAQPGDRITLRYGSAFDDVRFFYILAGPDGTELDVRWLPAGRGIKRLSIYVDSAMLGDFTVNLFAVKDGVTSSWGEHIYVPFRHKQLRMDITTFRDKLQPGEQEEWTIKVSGVQKPTQPLGHPAALIMSMYDDALTSYGRGSISLMDYPWRSYRSINTNWLSQYGYTRVYTSQKYYYKGGDPEVIFWMVDNSILANGRYRRGKYRGMELMDQNVMYALKESAQLDAIEIADEKIPVIEVGAPESGARITSDDIAHMPGVSRDDDIFAPVAGMGYSAGSQPGQSIQVRSNLSTLAFFVSDLRTDASGTATYRFRVPDILTRWRCEGFAFTKDLKIGTLNRYLVTQKALMVQPNIPRFLRHGDSLVLMAKVMNLTDTVRQVRVLFSLSNQNIPMILKEQVVSVPAQGSAQVIFPISNLPRDLYVATYEITAQTIDNEFARRDLPFYSDGERGQIPVVSSRQAVTLSQPLYINGKGEKTFTFHLSPFGSTAEPHFLAAELTTDPMWLAVKAMPYLKEQENPSTLYLANSLYVNTLAKGILEKIDIPEILGKTALLENTESTRLKMNEDIKQTLLEATPWLRDAQSEVEQRQAIVNYFDSVRINSELRTLNSELSTRQNPDGGWSWMPEGESSTWVTMQVLKRVNISTYQLINIENALAYVDREEQLHYEKYIKPYLKKGYNWEPDNIDYLYTRSFYGNGSTEAYNFYYKNALKNYKSYNNLYTQAQLALIFQRHGDKKAARDLIRRLKEKSLESDEMGMYWRDNRSGWCWYERPIETQALLIQAFREVTPKDTLSIALMQQWLLKQKQTTHWDNDRATVEAINALMQGERLKVKGASEVDAVQLTVLGEPLTSHLSPLTSLEGYRSQRWTGADLDTLLTHNSQLITLKKETPGIAWGAVYFQYTDDMDKIPSSESGITLKRTYIHEGPWKVGDRVKVHIEISVDRNMEYLELIDGRPSCVEPLSTRSGWHWSSGLHYYVEVKNTATHCYINRLEKGKYVVEYEVYVTNPGTFLAGPVTMQCMYAPEFRATAPAQRLSID